MKKENWKQELARDSMAFVSILFYFIVIIRAIVGKFMPFVYQLLIALAILIILSFIIKKANRHIAMAFILVVFTSLFYQDNLFTVFAVLLWIFMIGAAFYIKEKKEAVGKGIILGLIAALASYYLSGFF